MSKKSQDPNEEIHYPVEYSSRASDLLLFVISMIYVPLIVSPLLIIRFNFATSILMAVLVVVLGLGIYVLRGNPTKRKGVLKISPGDIRIESNGKSTLVIGSRGLSSIDSTTLRSSQASLFETRIVFRNVDNCEQAEGLIKKYY